MEYGLDHRDGYQRVKLALQALTGMLVLEAVQ
jgi:hypothetical protein